MPKVSIVIPVCNVRSYVKECVESVINQTLQDIEIICIDDCSNDGCQDILKHYAQQDDRIITIFHEENLGTSQARKDGVLASHGKYVMFCDGDDTLEANACEKAYAAIEKSHTDIVQFGVNVVNCAGASQGRIESNQRLVAPYLKKIHHCNLIDACWKKKLFGFSLWNKIYNGQLCRKAFSCIEDGYFPKAQDLYAFFVIAFFAKSSSGIKDKLYKFVIFYTLSFRLFSFSSTSFMSSKGCLKATLESILSSALFNCILHAEHSELTILAPESSICFAFGSDALYAR